MYVRIIYNCSSPIGFVNGRVKKAGPFELLIYLNLLQTIAKVLQNGTMYSTLSTVFCFCFCFQKKT